MLKSTPGRPGVQNIYIVNQALMSADQTRARPTKQLKCIGLQCKLYSNVLANPDRSGKDFKTNTFEIKLH